MPRSKKAQAAADFTMSLEVPGNQAGLGVDIVEINRMREILRRTPSFASKVFSAAECAYCDTKADPAASYAARFAAKEAVLKALGCGFAEGVGYHDVEVGLEESGRPFAKLYKKALEIYERKGIQEIALSLSHTSSDAIACAIALTEGSAVKPQDKVDSMTELARKFKEARSMLDDIGKN